MKKSPLVVANWKMNMLIKEGKAAITTLSEKLDGFSCMIAPPFTAIYALAEMKMKSITLGAQDLYPEEKGAFTGEISGAMIKDAGGEFVIAGHSERRTLFKEDNELIMRKIQQILREKLTPILCIGETMQERLDLRTEECLYKQLETLRCLSPEQISKLIIAYEPIWAIGAGKPASLEQVGDTHADIQRILTNFFGSEASKKIPILYGGSVKGDNARDLIHVPGVAGFLVGSASLNPLEFSKIIHAAHS